MASTKKNIEIRESRSGKSKYVLKVDGVKYRVNSYREGAEIAGVHLSRLNHIVNKGPHHKIYNVTYRGSTFQAKTLQEIADKLNVKRSVIAAFIRGILNGKRIKQLKYLTIEKIN